MPIVWDFAIWLGVLVVCCLCVLSLLGFVCFRRGVALASFVCLFVASRVSACTCLEIWDGVFGMIVIFVC